jgi:hypothetical protein
MNGAIHGQLSIWLPWGIHFSKLLGPQKTKNEKKNLYKHSSFWLLCFLGIAELILISKPGSAL